MSTAAILSMAPAAQPLATDLGESSGSGSASSGAAMVTANDFLTLLVTEMKNQDPTANQDPNAYINQLVQVNSLQQLISINEVLTNSLGDTSSAPASGTPTKQAVQSSGTNNAMAATGLPTSVSAAADRSILAAQRTSGNLSIPATSASAIGIAHAMDGSKPVITAREAITLR